MNWEDYKSAFTWDGSWRDLYVLDADLNDWQRLLELLGRSDYLVTFSRDHPEESMPSRVTELFNLGENSVRALMQVNVGGPVLNCHFFDDKEIEFDLDPREVQSVHEAEAIFAFMREVADVLGKPVRVTPENMKEIILMEYRPGNDGVELVNKWEDVWIR